MKKTLSPIAALVLAAHVALGGAEIMAVNEDFVEDPPVLATSRIQIDGRKMRMDLLEGPDAAGTHAVIFRGDSQRMVMIDHGARTYMEMDKVTMDAMGSQIGTAMQRMQEEMRKHMADMDPEQAAMMKEMMGGAMAGMSMPDDTGESVPESRVLKTSEKKTVGGYPCRRYEVRRGSVKSADVWVTDWKNVGIKEDTFDVLKDVADFYSGLTEALRQSPSAGMEWDAFEMIDDIDGYPVMIRDYDESGQPRSITTFKSAEEKKLSPDLFQVPAGYTRQDMPMMGGPGME